MIDPQACIAIGCIIMSGILGMLMTYYNYQNMKKTKHIRVAIRREYKKKKNAQLKKWLGL